MARLPVPGSDEGTWGDILNSFLQQSHTAQGDLKPDSVGSTQLQANSVTASQLAPNSVDTSAIAAGSITESQLDSAVQTKLNSSSGVTSVNTRTGDVTLTKSDVGLANVDNTSDANKPISTATQTALDAKADASAVGAKVLLINDAASLPPGTPAGVVVVVKS